jgi:aminopeptidase YwaD
MKKRLYIFGVVFFSFAVFIASASAYKNNNSIEKTIRYLSSSNLEGRLTGTDGAIKAEQYLKKELERIKLDKYKSDFSIPYDHIFYNPINQVHSIRLVFGEKVIDFNYGSDFLESIAGDIDKQLKLTFDANNISEDTVLVIDDREKLKGLNLAGRIIFIKEYKFKKNIALKNNSDIHIIQISNDMYKTLETNKDGNIEIQFKNIDETIKANNIVGKISGRNNKKAIVLSAHFDHVGMAGKSVFKGAVDNASGTSLLLKLAQELKSYYRDNTPEVDIIIAFLNGEESNLQGSKALVKILKSNYGELYNINLDCIGIKNGGELTVAMKSGINSKLMEDLKNHFDEKGYDTSIETSGLVSDHFTFLENNIAAVCIVQKNVEKIHTIEDEMDDVDLKYLEKLSGNLLGFLVKNINSSYTIDEQASNSEGAEPPTEEKQAEINKILESLKSHEYIKKDLGLFSNMHLILKNDSSEYKPVDKLKDYYPTLNLIKQTDNYNPNYIDIYELLSVDEEKLKNDKVYLKEYNIKDIEIIQIRYVNDKDKFFEIATLIETDNNAEYISQDYLMGEYKIEDDTIDINGELYNVCSKLEEYSLEAVYKNIKVDGKTFHVFLKADTLTNIKNLNLKIIIDSLINSL